MLHLVINERGEIINFKLTPGNVSDCSVELFGHLSRRLFGKLYGDKGCISKKLRDALLEKGVTLVTKTRKRMKPVQLDPHDRFTCEETRSH
jgi:hypothetical protein